ncbi:2-keto-4-pentenoate hydratase, partial [Candidatus Aerophobetes bacterium]|nr:2-keto-4-pentenoate hydratase [Candidatus Aerophobetes bacterium]
MLKEEEIRVIADELHTAEINREQIEPIEARYPHITIPCAYKIQLMNIMRKVKNGQKIIGKKIGLTSYSMQKLLGVYEPDYGHLMDTMLLTKNELSRSKVIQPKAEGEIAFIMKEDLKGPGITPMDVIRSTAFVVPAIEVIDSRIKDWKIKIQDTIADNASSAYVVIGHKFLPLSEIDMFSTGMVFCKNGEVVHTGAVAAVMGSPLNTVSWLINKLSEFGVGIKKGEMILSGAVTAAVDLEVGDVVEVIF